MFFKKIFFEAVQICQNIRRARESKGISQIKMADRLNVSRTTYRNWEEETEPSLAIIKSIADALEIPPHELLKGIIDYSNQENFAVAETQVAYSKSGNAMISIPEGDLQTVKESLRLLQTIFESAVFPNKLSLPTENLLDKKKDQDNGANKKGRNGNF